MLGYQDRLLTIGKDFIALPTNLFELVSCFTDQLDKVNEGFRYGVSIIPRYMKIGKVIFS